MMSKRANHPETEPIGLAEGVKRSVEIDGARTDYWEYGNPESGLTIVLVHGFRGDHHGLERIAQRLTRARVVAPDLPGFGSSEPLSSAAHDIDGYARWLRGFLVALAPGSSGEAGEHGAGGGDSTGGDSGTEERRTVLLGHSFGSIVVSAALALPEADAAHPVPSPWRVVLVNPIGAPALKGPRAVFTQLAVFYYWLAAALPERAGFWLLRNSAIVRVMSEAMAKTRDKALRRWIHAQHAAYFSAFANRAVVLEAFRASVSHDVSEYAARIREPVLLIVADRDDITPLAAQERLLRRFPDARMHVVSGVGHLVHYEAPAEAAGRIVGFLEDAPAEGSGE